MNLTSEERQQLKSHLISDTIHIRFSDDAPAETINKHRERKHIAREHIKTLVDKHGVDAFNATAAELAEEMGFGRDWYRYKGSEDKPTLTPAAHRDSQERE